VSEAGEGGTGGQPHVSGADDGDTMGRSWRHEVERLIVRRQSSPNLAKYRASNGPYNVSDRFVGAPIRGLREEASRLASLVIRCSDADDG